MRRTWLLLGLLLVAFAVIAWAQQAKDERTDHERIVELETRLDDVQRLLGGISDDGTVGMTPAALELRLARIETRLDRLEQLGIRSSGLANGSDRMTDSRLRNLEYAVMRLQQQR
jgi:hypothetical protein